MNDEISCNAWEITNPEPVKVDEKMEALPIDEKPDPRYETKEYEYLQTKRPMPVQKCKNKPGKYKDYSRMDASLIDPNSSDYVDPEERRRMVRAERNATILDLEKKKRAQLEKAVEIQKQLDKIKNEREPRELILQTRTWEIAARATLDHGREDVDTFMDEAALFYAGYLYNCEYGDYMPLAVASMLRATMKKKFETLEKATYQNAVAVGALNIALEKSGMISKAEEWETASLAQRRVENVCPDEPTEGDRLWES